MNTRFRTLFGVLCLLFGGATAHAQNAQSRPPISPYLNLFRGGGGVGSNYYNLVRPEIDFRASIQQLQQQDRTLQQSVTDLKTAPGALTTGHQAAFMTQGGFFQTIGSGPSTAGSRPVSRPGGK